ncbi:carboxymuconolactone decarboxylase family protein [Paenarthrobacter sp. Y-19]|jgi:AhpD family alkylhydroperoxidase|uniref:carboxymuconolactone decarboxylase family protein n=1 Tax=Paenarthrobacter sp. Y-19 TaxID=3031125 RepID=UPI001E77549E|nr:carboxymuconolactone decarboxylase family protein [Paenarthrobacter sp. Y-19]BCW12298.1 alkyl hydroperoxide reductase AhpD [Arthrobacter sp. NtRootA2]BCW16380.1 alkyl hydroperoxide reductase AhpD [Arthrobacter sp. NtRootA4]BCW24713.1 alkyl hydroperoxide reductase AhpD [Arthrobacter sp. NtRootC7]BCW28983.1 alkyl hydroperoxide reductase AhpD [Arthrobacter sp. NtRootC45]BCW33253.1 alkyl hydroperoxide reductase AhpD [Arthrobacter sp. NtRootD5]
MPEQETKPRLAGYLDKQQPVLYATLSHYSQQLVDEADRLGIPRRTLELINYLCSQINGCAFCLDLHHRRALKYGETEQRLSLVAVYKEVQLFEPSEVVAMEIAEQITRMSTSRPSPELFAVARQHYSDEQISVLCMAAIGINAFNRLSILSEHPVRANKK